MFAILRVFLIFSQISKSDFMHNVYGLWEIENLNKQ